MTGLEPISSDDQFAQLTEAVRAHNMAQIKELLAALKPYVEGMFGPINPGHVRVYLEALKQLGMYVKAFDRPAEKDPDEGLEAERVRQVLLAERQAAVLAELTKLSAIAGSDGSVQRPA